MIAEFDKSPRPPLERSALRLWQLWGRPESWKIAAETGLVFLVFVIQGALPVPEVNEPYYLGKAIHFWNPHWAANDFFLNTADCHKVFYFTFGWLALWLTPTALAWTGRLLTWALLAGAWRRLSFAVVPRAWWAVPTAVLLVVLTKWFPMAGEWIIGGVEAKGFAYVLVFLGLEAILRNRWRRTWLLLGGASAFHVLVGGWSAVAAGIVWLLSPRDRTPLRSLWPWILGGLALSMFGVLPALRLSSGIDPQIVRQADMIYVYERLPHHLVPSEFPLVQVVRFLGLTLGYFLLDRLVPGGGPRRRLRWFTVGSLAIAAVGMGANILGRWNAELAAGLLKYYWFRLSDVAVPLAAALLAADVLTKLPALLVGRWGTPARRRLAGRWIGRLTWAAVVVWAGVGAVSVALPRIPPADAGDAAQYWAWRRACQWIADPAHTPADARFLTPMNAQTFKWYSGRSEVVNWKEIPQDARSIVRWWDRLHAIHDTGSDDDNQRWFASLGDMGPQRLRRLGRQFAADYVLTERNPDLPLPVVYQNEMYIVYRLRKVYRLREVSPGGHAGRVTPPDAVHSVDLLRPEVSR